MDIPTYWSLPYKYTPLGYQVVTLACLNVLQHVLCVSGLRTFSLLVGTVLSYTLIADSLGGMGVSLNSGLYDGA